MSCLCSGDEMLLPEIVPVIIALLIFYFYWYYYYQHFLKTSSIMIVLLVIMLDSFPQPVFHKVSSCSQRQRFFCFALFFFLYLPFLFFLFLLLTCWKREVVNYFSLIILYYFVKSLIIPLCNSWETISVAKFRLCITIGTMSYLQNLHCLFFNFLHAEQYAPEPVLYNYTSSISNLFAP